MKFSVYLFTFRIFFSSLKSLNNEDDDDEEDIQPSERNVFALRDETDLYWGGFILHYTLDIEVDGSQ